ncbi:MAG TPA: MarR family transcriptional regulator [Bacteroidetes bacterium]|jgi:DNA-binding MarR family transcriptional regulator|nr:MarR family transcriptional regulator [Bacteroidota bacterium]
MSDQIQLIKIILDYVEQYSKSHKNDGIESFTHFLNEQVFEKNDIPARNLNKDEFHKENYNNYKRYAEVEFSTLLTNLYRFAKHYIKKAFQNTEIRTIDEFGFLATLIRQESLQKKDLINQHFLETSSGSEILKRLYSKGFIKESRDENDKRAKLVSLTPKGKEVIMNSFDQMYRVSEIIIGNLTDEELKQSLKIFNKLSDFHKNIDRNDKSSDLNKIYHKYISQDES